MNCLEQRKILQIQKVLLYRCNMTEEVEQDMHMSVGPSGASPCPCSITLVAVLDTVEDRDCAALSFVPARLLDTTFTCNGSQFVVQQVAKRTVTKRKKTMEIPFIFTVLRYPLTMVLKYWQKGDLKERKGLHFWLNLFLRLESKLFGTFFDFIKKWDWKIRLTEWNWQ